MTLNKKHHKTTKDRATTISRRNVPLTRPSIIPSKENLTLLCHSFYNKSRKIINYININQDFSETLIPISHKI